MCEAKLFVKPGCESWLAYEENSWPSAGWVLTFDASNWEAPQLGRIYATLPHQQFGRCDRCITTGSGRVHGRRVFGQSILSSRSLRRW